MATTSSANTGTASVASLNVTSAAIDPTLKAAINFTSDSGDYSWSLTDASNNVVSSGSATWVAGQPIALNGFELRLNGVPKTGDQLTVAKTQYPATSNGNALQMANLRDQAFVGRTPMADGSIAQGATVTDAYANAMADIGVRVQSAKMSSQISATVSSQADAAVASKTGVNLDEEAARLIQFQQSYQAAAKVLQVAQTVFDTLLQLKS
jgi:flagellar hook-associated protein 1 FlgK